MVRKIHPRSRMTCIHETSQTPRLDTPFSSKSIGHKASRKANLGYHKTIKSCGSISIQPSRSRNFPLKMPPSPKIIVLVVWFCHVFFLQFSQENFPPKEKVRSKSTSRKQNLARGWKKQTKKQKTLLRNLIKAIFFPVIGVRNSSAMPTSIEAKHAEKRVMQVPLKTLKRKRHLKKEMIFGYLCYSEKNTAFPHKNPGRHIFCKKKNGKNAS